MILVVGGLAAGKEAYVRSLGYGEVDFSSQLDAACPVITDVQELVRDEDADVEALASRIAAEKQVVLCVEVGSGIVPLDPGERSWRDRVGRLAHELAQRADAVVRVVCGLPTALKGTLPHGEASVQVVIMRHGTTTANELRRYAGKADVALSARGEQDAKAAGVCADVERVFVSPLQRARRTAEICFPNARQQVVDGLSEMDFGDFEGRSAQDMEDDAAYRSWVESNCTDPCPNGESRAILEKRVVASLERIVHEAQMRGDERVVIVGHGGTIMAAMDVLASDGREYFEWQVGNCQGYVARASFVDGRLRFDEPQKFTDLGFLGKRAPKQGPSFFQNRACDYFPCHEGVAEDEFNCLFCYCPLYALGPDCGGNFSYTERGRKNCKGCALPHRGEEGVQLVAEHYEQLAALAGKCS